MRRLLASSCLALGLALVAGRARADQPEPPASDEGGPVVAPTQPAVEPTETPAASQPPPIAQATPTYQSPPEAPAPAPARPWRYTATLGIVSLPRVLSLEAIARFRRAADPRWDLFAVGASLEYLPPGLASFGDKTKMSWLQAGVEGKFFPWRFLFAGLRFGYQFVRADSEKFGSEVDYVTTAFFVTPKIGALYTFPSGLTIGGDVGATIPLGADTTLESDGTTDSNARKVAKTFGMFVMPSVSFFRLGYTF